MMGPRLVTVRRWKQKRAADLYAQGWTLRQIGAELGVTAPAVSLQLRRAGITVRRGAPPGHRASTQKILELRDTDRPAVVGSVA
jgi:predicted transcriptional regulator